MRFFPHIPAEEGGQKGPYTLNVYFSLSPLPGEGVIITSLTLSCYANKHQLTDCCETTGQSRCIGSHTLKIRLVPSASASLFPITSLQHSDSQHCVALLLCGSISANLLSGVLFGRDPLNACSTSLVLQSLCRLTTHHPLSSTSKTYLNAYMVIHTERQDVKSLISVEHHRKNY